MTTSNAQQNQAPVTQKYTVFVDHRPYTVDAETVDNALIHVRRVKTAPTEIYVTVIDASGTIRRSNSPKAHMDYLCSKIAKHESFDLVMAGLLLEATEKTNLANDCKFAALDTLAIKYERSRAEVAELKLDVERKSRIIDSYLTGRRRTAWRVYAKDGDALIAEVPTPKGARAIQAQASNDRAVKTVHYAKSV